ncbi:MAG: hypothetical protein ABGZ17_17850, partial [Planctomycetaceae bacterium]
NLSGFEVAVLPAGSPSAAKTPDTTDETNSVYTPLSNTESPKSLVRYDDSSSASMPSEVLPHWDRACSCHGP